MFRRLLLKLPLEQQSNIFLFGPRGTGKTSWLRTHVTNVVYFDLLDFSTYSVLSSNPAKMETFLPPLVQGWIIIDEIQRIPELLNTVHKLIEEKRYKFILTGSSARTLRRQGINLLAGRALRYVMHPLVIDEVGDRFNLGFSLQYGMLPSVFEHHDPKKYLESYVQTYLREEVLQEGLTRNIGGFTRFLETASFSQGQVLNVSEIARELSLNRLTVSNYFGILDDLLLSRRISVFTHKAKRKMIAHQKFYFFDVGVYQTIRPTGPLDGREAKEGIALETLFLQSLFAINDYYELGYTIYFWRTLAGDEVDFVLYGKKGFYAFEIKRTENIHTSMFKGLRKFHEDYPECKLYFISLARHKEYHDYITVLPFIEALEGLKVILTT